MMNGYDPHEEMAKANLILIGATALALILVGLLIYAFNVW